MAVTCTYNTDLSRVTITATGLGDAITASVERSTNQIRWATVRGGATVAVTAGVMDAVDDYEFNADVVNYYRVTYTAAMSFVAAGAAAHGNNASVAPGLPAGLTQGDNMYLLAAIRNSGTGVPTTPTGWSKLIDAGNMCLYGKTAGASESAPTVSFTGGVANADTSGQIAAFRGVNMTPVVAAATQLNGSGQDIAVPAITLADPLAGGLNLWVGWKQDDWTSVDVVSGGTEIGEPDTTTGDDQGIVWDYRILPHSTTFTNLSTRTFTVTGGGAAISRAGTAVFEHALTDQIGSVTPTLDGVWLKFIARPFLNTQVDAYGEVNVTRRARNAVFDVVGRTVPVAVTDVRAGREYPLSVTTLTSETHSRLDFAVLGGDPVFVHAPPGSPVPTMYAVIGDTSDDQPVPGTHLWTLPLTEVAAPAPEIVGATITWQGVVNAYATWQDVLDSQSTWADLLTLIGDPADIITD